MILGLDVTDHMMAAYDPDVVRWGLHLLDVCSISTAGSCKSITQYEPDHSHVEYVRESYVEAESVENDEMIARAFQEELSRLTLKEAPGESTSEIDNLQASILTQDWVTPSKRFSNSHPDGRKFFWCLGTSILIWHILLNDLM